VDYAAAAEKNIAQCESMGLGGTPGCIAKTQYSFSTDPTLRGRPTGFDVEIREVNVSAGAGFRVAAGAGVMVNSARAADSARDRKRAGHTRSSSEKGRTLRPALSCTDL